MALSLLLPLRLMQSLAAFGWRIGGLFSPRRSIVAANLATIAAAGGVAATPGQVFASYGRYWAELVYLAARPGRLADLEIRVEGSEHLDAVAKERAILVLSAHLGSWDILSYWLGANLPGINILVEELKPPALFRLFARIREAGGARILPAEGAGPRLFRRLKAGEHAGLVGDRVFGAGQRNLPMFGGMRRLPSGGVEIAQRAGAAIVPIFLLRRGYSYVIKIYPDLSPKPDPVAAYAACLEAEILACPDQWCVLYPLHDARDDEAATGYPAPPGNAKGATVR